MWSGTSIKLGREKSNAQITDERKKNIVIDFRLYSFIGNCLEKLYINAKLRKNFNCSSTPSKSFLSKSLTKKIENKRNNLNDPTLL